MAAQVLGIQGVQKCPPVWAPFRPAPPSRCGRQSVHSRLVVTAAKKGGKGGGKKGPGSLMNIPKPSEQAAQQAPKKDPWTEANVIMHNLLLVESHFRKVGRPILEGEIEISEVAKALWNAPFVVLAHDKGPEPKFVYGNKAALELWECSWDELVGTPSRRSAEDKEEIQEDRQGLLDAANEKGFVDDYEGWRVSFKGRRFKIMRATLFNVEAPSGDVKGQAVVIPEWEYEDGTRGGMGVTAGGPAGLAPPTPEDIQAAEAAVQEQAAAVRQLKEDQGLTNADDEVKASVTELLSRKEKLEQLKQRAAAAAEATAAAEGGAEGQEGGADAGSQAAEQ